MLGDIERRLAALVADGVATRTHLTVGLPPLDPPAAGQGTVSVSLSEITPGAGFVPSDIALVGPADKPQSRRVLPLGFKADLAFAQSPAADTAVARADARTLMLEDVSVVAHLLADPALRSGTGFATAAPDPGFQVQSFQLDTSTIIAVADPFAASLAYRGQVQVWPVGMAGDEGVIGIIDTVIVPLPLTIDVRPGGVRPNAQTILRVAAPAATRLADAAGTRIALRVAVLVLSDVPPAQRGTIPAGVASTETGVRIVDVTTPVVAIPYLAPAGDPGPGGRTEYVAIHLAMPDNAKGLFLGSAAIRLVGP